jgi:hypothetical protein
VPTAPRGAPTGAVQLNDVFVDERQIVYADAGQDQAFRQHLEHPARRLT